MKIPDDIPVKRITLRTIGEEILAQFNLEKGIGYTIKGLLLRPRAVMEEYLFHDRHRLMRPLPFFPFLLDVSAFGVVVVVLSAWYYLYAYRSVFQTSWGEVAWKTVGVLIVSQTLQSIVFGVVFLVFWLVL